MAGGDCAYILLSDCAGVPSGFDAVVCVVVRVVCSLEHPGASHITPISATATNKLLDLIVRYSFAFRGTEEEEGDELAKTSGYMADIFRPR
jgi:hypothetical protein